MTEVSGGDRRPTTLDRRSGRWRRRRRSDSVVSRFRPGKSAIWLLMTGIAMLFAGFTSAYIVLRGVPTWQNIQSSAAGMGEHAGPDRQQRHPGVGAPRREVGQEVSRCGSGWALRQFWASLLSWARLWSGAR